MKRYVLVSTLAMCGLAIAGALGGLVFLVFHLPPDFGALVGIGATALFAVWEQANRIIP